VITTVIPVIARTATIDCSDGYNHGAIIRQRAVGTHVLKEQNTVFGVMD